MKENNNRGRSIWRFWFGLAAGVAAGMYLNSDEGRKLRKEYNERLSNWGQDISKRARDEFGNFSEKASEAIEKSKTYADETRNNLKGKVEKFSKAAEEAIDKTEENYEKAADWANTKLKKNESKKKK